MSDTLHAPLPWTFCEFALEGPCQGKEPYRIRPLQYQIRALTLPLKSSHVAILAVRAEDKANARLIVRACNSHDALLAACEAMRDSLCMHGPCEQNNCTECQRAYGLADAAIAKAEEPKK